MFFEGFICSLLKLATLNDIANLKVKVLSMYEKLLPTGGLEPPIFGLGDRRLIHWATRADVLRGVVIDFLFEKVFLNQVPCCALQKETLSRVKEFITLCIRER